MIDTRQSSESISDLVTKSVEKPGNINLVDFYIGLGLAVSSSIFIGTSFIIKKKALLKLASKLEFGQRASEGGYGYLKEWLWWMGVITMGIGEACNFAAYTFAPASLVTPLGALSVLVTAVLSSRMLKERLNLLGKIGCAICLLGSTSIVIHSPKEEEVSSMADLATKMKDAVFILYVVIVILITLAIVTYVAPRYGRSNILVYIAVCSLIGSLSVISVKGLGLAIKESISGSQQFTNLLTWFWLISVIACISVQLIYLNKALDIYNTSMVTPIYYVFFTTFVILASSILYKEWSCLGASDIIGNVIGFLTTIIGIFQMQLFRDVDIPFRKFRDYCKLQETSSYLEESIGGEIIRIEQGIARSDNIVISASFESTLDPSTTKFDSLTNGLDILICFMQHIIKNNFELFSYKKEQEMQELNPAHDTPYVLHWFSKSI